MSLKTERVEMPHAAHLAVADQCYFKRATALVRGPRVIIVSTVGDYHPRQPGGDAEQKLDSIGWKRWFETLVVAGSHRPKNEGCTCCPYVWRRGRILHSWWPTWTEENPEENLDEYQRQMVEAQENHEAAIARYSKLKRWDSKWWRVPRE